MGILFRDIMYSNFEITFFFNLRYTAMGNIYLYQSEPEIALGYFDDADELIRTKGM